MPQPAIIDRVRRVTPRSVLLELALGEPLAFSAGQAVLVGAAGSALRRPYSIAVGPHEAARTRRLELLVGLGADDTPGPHLPTLAAGTRVDLEGPIGTFVLPDRVDEPALLFVAGGTGIAPLRAMLHEALGAARPPRVSVLYSARTAAEFAFDEELSALARDGRIRYRKTATREPGASWQGGRGRISRAQLESAVEAADTLCFVCGPAALVHEVPRMLREIGIAPARIRVEEWAAPPAPTP
jgi:ferredoxin-NADP reductase